MRVPSYIRNNEGSFHTITPYFRIIAIDTSNYHMYDTNEQFIVVRIGDLSKIRNSLTAWYCEDDPTLDMMNRFLDKLSNYSGYYVFKLPVNRYTQVYWTDFESAPKVLDFSKPEHMNKYLEDGFWDLFEQGGKIVFHIPLMNSVIAYGKITDFINAQQQTLTLRAHFNDSIRNRRQ
jgi:hypothetical protein